MKYLTLCLLLLSISCKKDQNQSLVENLSATVVYKQINNVDPNLLSLDIYYTTDVNHKKPVVVYVHGGGWAIGDKANQIENKVNLFRDLNYILVSVNYRLSPYPYEPNNPDRIKYPVHNTDIADALYWIDRNISRYGGDKNKVVLLGHSAGAHLVALTGINQSFLENAGLHLSNIKGVAVIDTEAYDINEQIANGDHPDMFINAFGTDTTVNKDASPIYNISSNYTYPKFFIAKRGNAERIGYANEFIDKLQLSGVQVTQIDGSIYNHSEINNAIGQPNETLMTNALKDFLSACFE